MKISYLYSAALSFWFIFSPSGGAQAQHREVAVTFDDLPATGRPENLGHQKYVTMNLLEKIKSSGVPAIGFVNEFRIIRFGEIDQRVELLKMWLDDGHDLGNHTFSHVPINTTPFDEYTADLIRGETVTRMLLEQRGRKLKYFRHPQLRTGPNEEYRLKLSRFLEQRGYTVAPVTIDNHEYIYAIIYNRAKKSGDAELQKKIVDSYVEYLEEVFVHFERLSIEFLGRELKQILLLHANEINADHFDKIAGMIKRRGYKFITLDLALRDEAYRLPEVQAMRGLSWLHRWMLAKGLRMKAEPRQPKWIDELFAQLN